MERWKYSQVIVKVDSGPPHRWFCHEAGATDGTDWDIMLSNRGEDGWLLTTLTPMTAPGHEADLIAVFRRPLD